MRLRVHDAFSFEGFVGNEARCHLPESPIWDSQRQNKSRAKSHVSMKSAGHAMGPVGSVLRHHPTLLPFGRDAEHKDSLGTYIERLAMRRQAVAYNFITLSDFGSTIDRSRAAQSSRASRFSSR